MALATGTRVGSHEVVAKIGEGGMGEVYRARDTQLKRDVALKVLPADVGADPDRLARFQREAELLGRVRERGAPVVELRSDSRRQGLRLHRRFDAAEAA